MQHELNVDYDGDGKVSRYERAFSMTIEDQFLKGVIGFASKNNNDAFWSCVEKITKKIDDELKPEVLKKLAEGDPDPQLMKKLISNFIKENYDDIYMIIDNARKGGFNDNNWIENTMSCFVKHNSDLKNEL